MISLQPENMTENREFILTSSPSMDILISSKLRASDLLGIAGNDAKKNVEFMTALTKEGVYEITPQMQEQIRRFLWKLCK